MATGPTAPPLTGAVSIAAVYEARKVELQALEDAVTNRGAGSHYRAWQLLPRHLRRRAMSHNPYRLPKRLRQMAVQQMLQSAKLKDRTPPILNRRPMDDDDDDDDATNSKKRKNAQLSQAAETDQELIARLTAPSSRRASRPPRAIRRNVKRMAEMSKPGGQLIKDDANNTSKRPMWLETHLWHTKRFHMDTRWGYRMATAVTNKSGRAVYRSSINSSVIWDSSFMETISVGYHGSRPLDVLFAFLRKFCVTITTPRASVANALVYNVVLKHPENGRTVSPAIVNSHVEDDFGELYVWILPAGFQDALSLLKQHADAAGVTIKTNRGQFNRFEILGPRAGQLLASAVFGKSQEYIPEEPAARLLQTLLRAPHSSRNASAGASGFLADNALFSLNIRDPRLTLKENQIHMEKIRSQPPIKKPAGPKIPPVPKQRTLSEQIQALKSTTISHKNMERLSNNNSTSKMWSVDYRTTRSNWRHFSDANVNQAFSGSPPKPSANITPENQLRDRALVREKVLATRVPAIIHSISPHVDENAKEYIHNEFPPSSTGWVVIVPRSWGAPTWNALIQAGARPIGWREREDIDFECAMDDGVLPAIRFPIDWPDALSYDHNLELMTSPIKAKWARTPKSKRANFASLDVQGDPFRCDWSYLMKNSSLPTTPPLVQEVESQTQLILSCAHASKLGRQNSSSITMVRFSLEEGGTKAHPNARIYALDSGDGLYHLVGFATSARFSLRLGLCGGIAGVLTSALTMELFVCNTSSQFYHPIQVHTL